MGLDDSIFVSFGEISANFKCSICESVYDDPVFAAGQPCQCIFCRKCIATWLADNSSCPIDRKPLDMSKMVPAVAVRGFIDDLKCFCPRRSAGCFWAGRYDARAGHEDACLALRAEVAETALATTLAALQRSEAAQQVLGREAESLRSTLASERATASELADWFARRPRLRGRSRSRSRCSRSDVASDRRGERIFYQAHKRLGIRMRPDTSDDARISQCSVLEVGERFEVSEMIDGAEGQKFLKLADGRGWAFTKSPKDTRVICLRVAEGGIFFKVTIPDGTSVGIRTRPDTSDEARCGRAARLKNGERFKVSEIVNGANGQKFLKLADGRGWVFAVSPTDGRTICQEEAEVVELE